MEWLEERVWGGGEVPALYGLITSCTGTHFWIVECKKAAQDLWRWRDGFIYIIREEGSIFAPQRIPFCMALGVAACTVGKVRVSTVFMCVCSTFRPSDFLLFVKNGFVMGVRCQGNSESLKECEYPHCASATRRLALDNRTYSAQLDNSTHTRCRPTLSWMGGRGGRVVRAEGGRGGREGGRGGR